MPPCPPRAAPRAAPSGPASRPRADRPRRVPPVRARGPAVRRSRGSIPAQARPVGPRGARWGLALRRSVLRFGSRFVPVPVPVPVIRRRIEQVARAARGPDVARVLGIGLDVLAQAQDVIVHGERRLVVRVPPRLLEETLARQYLARMMDQVLEQPEFAVGERLAPPRAMHLEPVEVHLDVAEAETPVRLLPLRDAALRPPQVRPHPRQQLA